MANRQNIDGEMQANSPASAASANMRDTAGPNETNLTECPRILIVEDDFFVSLGIESVLTEAGFRVVGIANSAAKAEQIASHERPDLIIMDVNLSGQRDGIEAALEIFRSTGIRAIFATGHADATMRERAESAHPLGWLPKPYSMQHLVEAIRQALKRE